MRKDRKQHLYHALVVLKQLQDMGVSPDSGVGNSELSRYLEVSRQTVNKVMKQAANLGYVNVNHIEWRPGVFAKRYTTTDFYNQECHDHFSDMVRWWVYGY